MTTLQTSLQLISSILASVGAIAVNPAFGIAGAAAKIIPIIGMLSGLAAEGEGARSKLVALDARLKAIVASGAPPTEDDWREWTDRHEAAKARLQA